MTSPTIRIDFSSTQAPLVTLNPASFESWTSDSEHLHSLLLGRRTRRHCSYAGIGAGPEPTDVNRGPPGGQANLPEGRHASS